MVGPLARPTPAPGPLSFPLVLGLFRRPDDQSRAHDMDLVHWLLNVKAPQSVSRRRQLRPGRRRRNADTEAIWQYPAIVEASIRCQRGSGHSLSRQSLPACPAAPGVLAVARRQLIRTRIVPESAIPTFSLGHHRHQPTGPCEGWLRVSNKQSTFMHVAIDCVNPPAAQCRCRGWPPGCGLLPPRQSLPETRPGTHMGLAEGGGCRGRCGKQPTGASLPQALG
jgi:hypothetical protein